MCARLEGDSPMVEEFELPLDRACSGPRHLTWHSVGDDGAVLGGLPLASLSGCGGVVFCCVRLFACVVCVVVVFASAR